MSKIIFLIVLCGIFFTSCNHKNTVKTLKVLKFYTYEFDVDNKNTDCLGYKVYENDEDIGVKGIYVFKNDIYVTDVYHTNIKKIDIKTGKMKSSKNLSPFPADESGIWIRDIAVFNDSIYVTSDNGALYVFDKNLKYQRFISIEKGVKYFSKITKDTLLINHSFFLNKKGNLIKLSEQKNIQENNQVVQGQKYSTYKKNGIYYFESRYGKIELKKPIPELKDYSGAENLNFNISFLVYFNSTKSKYIFYIYKW